jgi:hypothetical protein
MEEYQSPEDRRRLYITGEHPALADRRSQFITGEYQ